jgi:hypothetical protein
MSAIVQRFYTGSARYTLVMAASKGKKSKGRARLSFAQIEVVGQFNDYAWDNPKLTFEEVAQKALGSSAFPRTPNGRKFRSECKNMFDWERKN